MNLADIFNLLKFLILFLPALRWWWINNKRWDDEHG